MQSNLLNAYQPGIPIGLLIYTCIYHLSGHHPVQTADPNHIHLA